MRRLFLATLLLACGQPAPELGVVEGLQAAPLEGSLRGGPAWSLQAQMGKPTMVVFWASWCAPCMQEIPHLNALKEEYGDRIELVGVNMGEPEAKVYMTQRQQGMAYESILDTDGRIASAWKIRKLPLMLVFDKEGRIRFRGIGSEAELKVLIDSLVNS